MGIAVCGYEFWAVIKKVNEILNKYKRNTTVESEFRRM